MTNLTQELFPTREYDPNYVPRSTAWIIDSFLLQGRIAALLGAEKSGKSRLLAWLFAHCYANRRPWGLGIDRSRLPKRVMYLAGEELFEDVIDRTKDYLKFLGADPLMKLPWGIKEAAGFGFENPKQREALRTEMIAGGYDMLVLEPWARLHDAKENSNDDMRPMHNFLRQAANNLGWTIWLIHHTGKLTENFDETRIASWARGASDLATLVDTAAFVRERARGKGWRKLEVARAGRFPPLDSLKLMDCGDPCEGGQGFVQGWTV